MNYLIVLIVLFATIYTNMAWIAEGGPSTNPAYPNDCYVDGIGYDVGIHTPIGKCIAIICYPGLHYIEIGCGSVEIDIPGYYWIRDNTKPYPECCIKLVKKRGMNSS